MSPNKPPRSAAASRDVPRMRSGRRAVSVGGHKSIRPACVVCWASRPGNGGAWSETWSRIVRAASRAFDYSARLAQSKHAIIQIYYRQLTHFIFMPKKSIDEKVDDLTLMVGRGFDELRGEIKGGFAAVEQRLDRVEFLASAQDCPDEY